MSHGEGNSALGDCNSEDAAKSSTPRPSCKETAADIAAALAQLGGTEATFVNDYTSFYPSTNLSYTVDDRNQWVLSYNRRVNRPRGRQVNPFVDNADPRNLRYGNPFLLPEYTDGLELGHQLTTKALTVTTSLFYKTTRDVIRRFISVDDAGIAYRTYVNLARQTNSGLEVVAMWRKGRSLQLRDQRQHLPPKNRRLQPCSRPWKQWLPGQRRLPSFSAPVKEVGRSKSTDDTGPHRSIRRALSKAISRTARP